MRNNNPFILSGFSGKKYFCDREKELAILHENIKNGRNTVLFSWRRMGKTSLIRYLLQELEEKNGAETLYADLLATRNTDEAVKVLASAAYHKFGKTSKGISQSFGRLLGRLGMELSFDPMTGIPSFGFTLQKAPQPEASLEALGEFLSTQKKGVVIAIDEFQQVSHYQESQGEAVFRSWMQNYPDLKFIYSGSHRGIMTSMFTSENRPFYRSAELLLLESIPKKEYTTFIHGHFSKGGKEITSNALERIFEWSLGQTYAIQMLCNKLYGRYQKAGNKELTRVIDETLKQESSFFSQYVNLLSTNQWKVLFAIAQEENVENPLSSSFIKAHDLKAPSSVQAALEMLRKKEIVIKDQDTYRVHDVIFLRWLQVLRGNSMEP